nr:MAG TPA: hypothetical protein [Caudoviricetes sp.]
MDYTRQVHRGKRLAQMGDTDRVPLLWPCDGQQKQLLPTMRKGVDTA